MAWEPVSAGEAETEDQGMEGDMAQSTEQDTGGASVRFGKTQA